MISLSLFYSCSSKRKPEVFSADFDLGKMKILSQSKQVAEGYELTLITRYELKNKILNPELSTYFQYHLGNKINLVIDGDTIKPGLAYYVPLISETEKEIDCKYLLEKGDMDKAKRIIVNDSILGLNTVNISFK
jgi:hypothetical protein